MKFDAYCLPCLMHQVVKVADLSGQKENEALYRKVFEHLTEDRLFRTAPEIFGETVALMAEETDCKDPYRETRNHFNRIFLQLLPQFDEAISAAADPFAQAVRYAIMGNIIDFGQVHAFDSDDVLRFFHEADAREYAIDEVESLRAALKGARRVLYLGDNCGEICLDKLLLKQIRLLAPQAKLTFGVRGVPIINDSIEEDAWFVGIDEYAEIISNGSICCGTILPRTSEAFRAAYQAADVVISKGQGNYESLNDERGKEIYFLLMAKCAVIAQKIGVPVNSQLCMKSCG